MFKHMSTNTINTILIIGVILLVLEVTFFNGGLIFSLLFSSIFLYIGRKRYRKLSGKIMFWIGMLSLVLTILNMIAVRFLIIVILVLFVRHYFRSKKEPERTELNVQVDNFAETEEPFIKQKLFGDQMTAKTSYKWQDVNVHGGFGDRIIDLSHTVLPHDEAVISIRHLVGNVQVYVPYEVEVAVNHSAVLGRAAIFQYRKTKLFNQTMSYRTPDYVTNKPRVKIITSIVSGDLEVKRI
ncbi:cell wall-active antibiotics response protein LiaF [Halobacillus shinanisalinarum]|uniref:Cell wall-active antibiotics response protein LiaF n=1 Tax=Halobacillus shinanisalinarum TaxID=2932258 RepID=A0ABY4H6K8_9BACI|nr:cell wall-active antibiotics response protein LiaF [Halobacillus shinanisalinarum]UOQ95222.1 cell wall-active antibiotics response protein LiaF [Halobacillus shinanisalinarum]